MKRFNTTAVCIPQKHYMVDISEKLEQMIGCNKGNTNQKEILLFIVHLKKQPI